MSLLGYTWPPIDTYKERLEMFQNEALRAQEVLSNERQVEATAESLGYGMTAYERAVHDRADISLQYCSRLVLCCVASLRLCSLY